MLGGKSNNGMFVDRAIEVQMVVALWILAFAGMTLPLAPPRDCCAHSRPPRSAKGTDLLR